MRDRYLYEMIENERRYKRLDKAFKKKLMFYLWLVFGMFVGFLVFFNVWAIWKVQHLQP